MTTEQPSKFPPEPIHERLDREAKRLTGEQTESYIAGIEFAAVIAELAQGRIDAHNDALLAEARDEALRLRAFIADRLPAGLATPRRRVDCGMPVAVDFDSLAEDAREVLAAQAAAEPIVDDPHGDTLGMRNPQRLECDDCGATFPYSYQSEISLPAHGCAERQWARKAADL